MISEDPSNNSAWSYRYFLIAKTEPFTVETFTKEILYALGFVKSKDSRENEAVCVYIKGHYFVSSE